jgi:hypothetical protein
LLECSRAHDLLAGVTRKPPLSQRKVAKMREREASVGVDAEDEAARWLAEHDPPAAPKAPKSLGKNKALHRWRSRRGG